MKGALVAVCSLLLLPVRAFAQSGFPDVSEAERKVLMELYASTGGERWKDHRGWGTSASACDWNGVWCDFSDGEGKRGVVMGLSLSLNNLVGTLPASLAQLSHLQTLSVMNNQLTGPVPEALLDRWDRHQFEFDGSGNSFSNLVATASIEYLASGLLCDTTSDVWYRVEIDEPKNRTTFQSVRCVSERSRKTYCLVRESRAPSLVRLSRALKSLGFTKFDPDYDYPFTAATHGVYITTAAVWGDGTQASVRTYNEQGPIEVWTAQRVFLALVEGYRWDRETRKPKCDFQK